MGYSPWFGYRMLALDDKRVVGGRIEGTTEVVGAHFEVDRVVLTDACGQAAAADFG